MKRKVFVAGVGMVPFTKPGMSDPYHVMGANAARAALKDAGVDYHLVQQAYVGYVYGDSTCGQAALYQVGLSGIPVVNVNNNCSTGSTALYLARQAVESGAVECALALGFEQMNPGALKSAFTDRPTPLQRFVDAMDMIQGYDDVAPRAAQLFGGAGRACMEEFGTSPATFAKIAVKARRHAAKNPSAVFRNELSEEEILASPMMFALPTAYRRCDCAAMACASWRSRAWVTGSSARVRLRKGW